MEATERTVSRRFLAVLAVAAFAVAGCDRGPDEALSGFSGGTSSKNKKQIPSMVKSSTNPSPEDPAESPAPQVVGGSATTKQPMSGGGSEGAEASGGGLVSEQSEAESLREYAQAYRATRTRDPFRSLISSDQDRTQIVDLSVVTLVGVVWAHPKPFCIVEDTEGISYILRKGDRVKNGRIVAVHRDKLVASQTILGYTTTVQLNLDKGKDGTHG